MANSNNRAMEEDGVVVMQATTAAVVVEHGNCGIYSQFVIFRLLLCFPSIYVILWQRQKRSNQLEIIVSSQYERPSMKVIQSGIMNFIIVLVVITEREMLFLVNHCVVCCANAIRKRKPLQRISIAFIYLFCLLRIE